MHKEVDLSPGLAYNFKKRESGEVAMKTPGMIRKIDDLGRIVLPSQLRKSLDLQCGDELEVYMEENCLVLKKFSPACIFCGEIRGLMSFRGKNVCGKCIQIMKDSRNL